MSDRPRTAYITGGASGIGAALTLHLLKKGWHVFIADRNAAGAEQFVKEHDPDHERLYWAECDTASWDSQLASFQQAFKFLDGRIDFVAPIAGIGEKQWLPFLEQSNALPAGEFQKPNLSVVDIDLTGVLYTIALAVQQFRRQDAISSKEFSGRGKIGLVASVCGFYCVPTLPIYTAAKHGLIGLTRSYGKLLPKEGITVNAIAPHVVKTAISSEEFYDKLEQNGLLTPLIGLLASFEDILSGDGSGQVYECGPQNGDWTIREEAGYLDEKSRLCCELLQERGQGLHYTIS